MKTKYFFYFILFLSLGACTKRDIRQDEPVISTDESYSDKAAMKEQEEAPVFSGSAGDAAPSVPSLEPVYFPFDSDRLTDTARETLKNNAQWMNENPDVTIQIEGHCDERGSTQYNLALGERRAQVTKRYMQQLGVNTQRLSTISFGEERPQDSGHDEKAWARNRRAMFVRVGG